MKEALFNQINTIMIFSMHTLDEKGWEKADGYPEGTLMKVLRNENGCKTALLKLPPHFHMDAHTHISAEQHYVLEGFYMINNIVFKEGSYQRIPPNEEHGSFMSPEGATILVIWDRVEELVHH